MSDQNKSNATPLDEAEYEVKRSIVTLYEALVLAHSLGLDEEHKNEGSFFGPEVSYAMLNLKNMTSGSRRYTGK